MATKSTPSKREAILNAMLDIVVERGFHDAPMSLLARRSGASPGIIYHYFASKEEIIQALFERVRTRKREAFLTGFDPDRDPGQVFADVFASVYRFYREYQREMRFYALCESAGFACHPPGEPVDEPSLAFAQRFSSRSDGGVLRDWPREVLQEATLGLVERLAAHPAPIAEPLLRQIAHGAWQMVRAED